MEQQTNRRSLLSYSIATLSVASFIGLLFLGWQHFKNSPNIAFVKVDQLLESYQGMVEAKASFQVKLVSWQAKSDTLEQELKLAIKQFEEKKESLSKKQNNELSQSLQRRQQQVLNYQQAIREQAQKEDQKITEGVLAQVNAFLESYGQRNGYSLLLGANGNGSILYGNHAIDITEEVITALNQEHEGL